MRVVSGLAGRMPLAVPRGMDVRPTMDKVRAAVFDSLSTAVIDADVADLFAGSGALGIEALSRGARSADFIDSDQRAVDCIKANLESTQTYRLGCVRHECVSRFIKRQSTTGKQYNLVFADPPYSGPNVNDSTISQLLGAGGVADILAPDGLLVLECAASHDSLDHVEDWQVIRDKKYGRTRIAMLRPTADRKTKTTVKQ